MSCTASPLDSLSVKLIAPYTNAPVSWNKHKQFITSDKIIGKKCNTKILIRPNKTTFTTFSPIRSASIVKAVTSKVDPPTPNKAEAPYADM